VGRKDAPGTQATTRRVKFGILQEFIAGNEHVGGVYYQVLTMNDGRKTRVIESNVLKLSAEEFREALRFMQSSEYTRDNGTHLFRTMKPERDTITPYPERSRKICR